MPQSTERTRLLHFDDEVNFRTLFALGAEREGFDVQSAATVEETLALLDEFEPQVVVLDIMNAGELDAGIELCATVCAHRGLSPFKVLALSNRDDETARAACLEAGADDFIVKRGSLRECVDAIRKSLGESA